MTGIDLEQLVAEVSGLKKWTRNSEQGQKNIKRLTVNRLVGDSGADAFGLEDGFDLLAEAGVVCNGGAPCVGCAQQQEHPGEQAWQKHLEWKMAWLLGELVRLLL